MNKAVRSTLSSLVNPQAVYNSKRVCWRSEDRACGVGLWQALQASDIVAVVCPHALFPGSLMATGSCCLILTGRLSMSLVKGENQPFAEMADPYPCSWGPSIPIQGRKAVFPEKFIDGLFALRQVGPLLASPPSTGSACVVFTLSGLPMGPALVAKHYTGSHMEWVCR